MADFSAAVDSFANRIAHGRLSLDGKTYQVPSNWRDRHALHGGPVGTGQKLWKIGAVTDDSLRLDLVFRV